MNAEGLQLLKTFEGWRGEAYIPVPGDVWTVGYGFTEGVKPGDKMTKQQGVARLKKELLKYEGAVSKACTVTANENQQAAMSCLSFNIGIAGFLKSSVLKAHNRGDLQSASRAFCLWNKSSGVVYAGLTRRRAAEASLYLKPEPEKQEDHAMPQTVDAETTLAKSPIGLMGAVTTTGGVLGTLSSVGDQAGDVVGQVTTVTGAVSKGKGWIAEIVGTVGLTPLAIGGIALIVIGCVVMYFRWKQRSSGFA